MNLETRDRLIASASTLFASNGYRGASVRDICNQARCNPGAVSYHFGGKRQLYRTVLRQAAERLAAAVAGAGGDDEEQTEAPDPVEVVLKTFRRIREEPVASRVLLRDLVEGGTLAVEALEPTLRAAVAALAAATGAADTPQASKTVRVRFLELASPVFLLTAAWPIVARALDLQESDRDPLLDTLILHTKERSDEF
jgi:AcrR family transcriptional regulator